MDFKSFMNEKMEPLLEKNIEYKQLNEKYAKALNLYERASRVCLYTRKDGYFDGLESYTLENFKKSLVIADEQKLNIQIEIAELEKKLQRPFSKKKVISMDIADLKDRLRMIPKEMIEITEYIDFMKSENAQNIDVYIKGLNEACDAIKKQIAKQILREYYKEPVVENELKLAIFDHNNYLKSKQNSPEFVAVSEIVAEGMNKRKVQEFFKDQISQLMNGEEVEGEME